MTTYEAFKILSEQCLTSEMSGEMAEVYCKLLCANIEAEKIISTMKNNEKSESWINKYAIKAEKQ